MRRKKTGVLPSVDAMESRLLLSTTASVLSRHTLTGVVREVRSIVSTLAKTENTAQASARLTGLALQIPSGSTGLGGSTGLALSWQSDIGLYRPHSERSIIATQKRLLGDLYLHLQLAGNGSTSPVSGSGPTTPTTPNQGSGGTTPTTPNQGSGGTTTPSPPVSPGPGTTTTPNPPAAPSLDSVQIQNTTGLALNVTVILETPQFPQPSITETISAQPNSTATFDFGTATGDFMMMNVSRAGGGDTPPPWDNINLSQPMNGYNGIVFTVSLFGSYFSVNVP
jgi:hypothetical protein